MKYLLTLSLSVFILTSCFNNKNPLTKEELALVDSLQLDKGIAEDLKRETRQPVKQIPWINKLGEVLDTKAQGYYSQITDESGFESVLKLKDKFRANGYLIFVLEENNSKRYLATIKGANDLEIIKFRQTNGFNYGLDNNAIITKLSNWKTANDFVVLGASSDWIELKFTTMPADLDTFIKDVYAFCPDIVDQSTGNKDVIKMEMQNTNGRLYLWWD